VSDRENDGPETVATTHPAGYVEWIADVKLRIRGAQQRAALAVNKEMLQLYWQIGRDILDRQAAAGWGTGILGRIEADLRAEFLEMRGFSQTNLKYMRMFVEAWPDLNVMGQRFALGTKHHAVDQAEVAEGSHTDRPKRSRT